MKLAIIGSRNIFVENFAEQLPYGITEIVSGGAHGVDTQAADFAKATGIPLTEFLPQYARFGKAAPLKRNEEIAKYADEAIAFWDGFSRGTAHTIALFHRYGKNVTIKKV